MYKEIQSYTQKHRVHLVAVSKTKSVHEIRRIYDLGHRDFGENRVQELLEKYEHLPDDIRWHLIGHLQRNKVKYIAPFVYCIQSADSFKLLKEINKYASRNERRINVLLQIKIAREATKFGFPWKELIAGFDPAAYPQISFRGVMGIGTLISDENITVAEFRQLRSYFTVLKSSFFPADDAFREISMGMSSDYKLAIDEGSTMVRVGSLIFGPRN